MVINARLLATQIHMDSISFIHKSLVSKSRQLVSQRGSGVLICTLKGSLGIGLPSAAALIYLNLGGFVF